jgi:ABC-type Fe3+ transport system permease subunit
MSLEVECGWTLLRALILALIATPTAALLARSLGTASPRSRQWQVVALAIPLLTPGFVVGYSYSNLTLDLVHSPLLNELFYDLLLLFQIVPVGVLVLWMAPPPPLGPTGSWCLRLVGPRRLAQVDSYGRLGQIVNGPARNLVPAFGLMALLVFHEFEIASLFRVIAGQRLTPASWSNAMFELIALQGLGERSPWDLWQSAWLPMICSLALLAPLVALVRTAIRDTGTVRPIRAPANQRIRQVATWTWLAVALAVATVIPLATLIRDALTRSFFAKQSIPGLARAVEHSGRSLVPAVIVAVCAAVLAGWLLQRRRLKTLMVVSLPGLLGSLLLGLSLTWLLLMAGPAAPRHSLMALCLGQTLWLLPRAALLVVLLAVLPNRESTHLARLLMQAPTRRQRTAGWKLVWQQTGRRAAWLIGMLCWWSYLELTLNELLASPQWLSVAHRMYQQMHFGRNTALSTTTLIVMLAPVAILALLVSIDRLIPGPRLGGTR